MHGSLNVKIKCTEFVDRVNCFDIVMLNETWTNVNSDIKLSGYKHFCKHRFRKKGGKRDSGGIVIYIKEEIFEGISEVDWDFEDAQKSLII